jgi:hypothetical protein
MSRNQERDSWQKMLDGMKGAETSPEISPLPTDPSQFAGESAGCSDHVTTTEVFA